MVFIAAGAQTESLGIARHLHLDRVVMHECICGQAHLTDPVFLKVWPGASTNRKAPAGLGFPKGYGQVRDQSCAVDVNAQLCCSHDHLDPVLALTLVAVRKLAAHGPGVFSHPHSTVIHPQRAWDTRQEP